MVCQSTPSPLKKISLFEDVSVPENIKMFFLLQTKGVVDGSKDRKQNDFLPT